MKIEKRIFIDPRMIRFNSAELAEYEPGYNYLEEIFKRKAEVQIPYAGSFVRLDVVGRVLDAGYRQVDLGEERELTWDILLKKINRLLKAGGPPLYIVTGYETEGSVYRLLRDRSDGRIIYTMDFDHQHQTRGIIGDRNTYDKPHNMRFSSPLRIYSNRWLQEDRVKGVNALYVSRDLYDEITRGKSK